MRKLLMKFQSFMQDRYARMDSVSLTAFVIGILLGFIGRIVLHYNTIAGIILSVLEYAFLIYAVWRPFSKAIWKRDKENRAFSAVLFRIKNWFLLVGRRIKFVKTSVFSVCPRCKAQLKLPRKRGKHTVKCPKCGNRYAIRIVFGKK